MAAKLKPEATQKELLLMDQVVELLSLDDASSFVCPAMSAPRSSATKLEASSTLKAIKAFVAANAPAHRSSAMRLEAASAC